MRIILFLAGICCAFAAYPQRVLVKGSDTMLPLMRNMAEAYPNAPIALEGGGSFTGVRSLRDGSAHIAIASGRASGLPSQAKEVVVAYDALSVIVNLRNPVGRLTLRQLSQIFTGQIRNWKEVGGPNAPINVYKRDAHSGTQHFVQRQLLQSQVFIAKAVEKPSNSAVANAVSTDPHGIGYVGFSYLDDMVKPLAIGDGQAYWTPSLKNVVEKQYPLMRPLCCYYIPGKNLNTDRFVDFLRSKAGQSMVINAGYIPF